MRILELQEYAQDNGFDKLKFKFINLQGKVIKGQFIDAYFGLFRIEGMEENKFMMVHDWRKQISDDAIEFEIDEESDTKLPPTQ